MSETSEANGGKSAFVFKNKIGDDPDEPSNEQRADWGAAAVYGFLDATGEPGGVCEDSIRDLIADVLHLADREGLDAMYILDAATRDWQAERE